MKLGDINPVFEERVEQLKAYSQRPSLKHWQDNIANLIRIFDTDIKTIDEIAQWLHVAQRTLLAYDAGLENSAEFLDAIKATNTPLWDQYTTPPVSDELQQNLDDKLYNIERSQAQNPDRDPYAILIISDQSKVTATHILNRLITEGIPFDIEFMEPDIKTLALNNATDERVSIMAQAYVEKCEPATTRIAAFVQNANIKPDPDKNALYTQGTKSVSKRSMSGDLYFTLTKFPTTQDAKKEGIDYDDYVQLFFEMCDQPWEQIQAAQDLLIEKFDTGKDVHITNDDGTDITLSITDTDGTPFTFCNSVIAKNVPGSEIFSSPRRDGVNGTVVAKGKFRPNHDSSKVIKDLTMHFKDGQIVDSSAAEGHEYFLEYLNRHPDNRYVGELGLGSNPHLRQHVTNTLLVEKIGGSFHLALGACYQYTNYEGKDVNVKNGNDQTSDHWDITTLLRGKHGNIYLDGEKVMENGQWIGSELDVLNQGWAAVPVAQRPDYWKSFQGYDKNTGQALWNNQAAPQDPAQQLDLT